MKRGIQSSFIFRLAALCVTLGVVAVYSVLGSLPGEAVVQGSNLQKYPSSILLECSDSITTSIYFPVDGAVRELTNVRGINFIVLETVNGKAMPPIVNGIELGSTMAIGEG